MDMYFVCMMVLVAGVGAVEADADEVYLLSVRAKSDLVSGKDQSTRFDSNDCFEQNMRSLPLIPDSELDKSVSRKRGPPKGMEGVRSSKEKSVDKCQSRCRMQDGCVFFTFERSGRCYLQDGRSTLVEDSDGAVTGPAFCPTCEKSLSNDEACGRLSNLLMFTDRPPTSCGSLTCTVDECCMPRGQCNELYDQCHSSGFKISAAREAGDLDAELCRGKACIRDECCDRLDTCSRKFQTDAKCGVGWTLLPNSKQGYCSGTECSVEECCFFVDTCAASFNSNEKCGLGLMPNPGLAKSTNCTDRSACTPTDCCVDRGTCAASYPNSESCGAVSMVTPGRPAYCRGPACEVEECCSPRDSCRAADCGRGWTSKLDLEASFLCDNVQCETRECCSACRQFSSARDWDHDVSLSTADAWETGAWYMGIQVQANNLPKPDLCAESTNSYYAVIWCEHSLSRTTVVESDDNHVWPDHVTIAFAPSGLCHIRIRDDNSNSDVAHVLAVGLDGVPDGQSTEVALSCEDSYADQCASVSPTLQITAVWRRSVRAAFENPSLGNVVAHHANATPAELSVVRLPVAGSTYLAVEFEHGHGEAADVHIFERASTIPGGRLARLSGMRTNPRDEGGGLYTLRYRSGEGTKVTWGVQRDSEVLLDDSPLDMVSGLSVETCETRIVYKNDVGKVVKDHCWSGSLSYSQAKATLCRATFDDKKKWAHLEQDDDGFLYVVDWDPSQTDNFVYAYAHPSKEYVTDLIQDDVKTRYHTYYKPDKSMIGEKFSSECSLQDVPHGTFFNTYTLTVMEIQFCTRIPLTSMLPAV